MAPPRGPYAKTAAQRENIIDIALQYFAQFGFHGVSMREIARTVGLSQAGLLHHFPTKADLLIAVLASRDARTRELWKRVSKSHTPLVGLVGIVEDNARNRNLVQMFSVISAEATQKSHPAYQFFVDRSAEVIGHFAGVLRTAVELGHARADLDIEMGARRCSAMMNGLQIQWLLDEQVDMVSIFATFLHELTDPD